MVFWIEIFLFDQWFLALFNKYAAWCRGTMLHCSMRCRINMLRLNILTKPVPHSIQHCPSNCADIVREMLNPFVTEHFAKPEGHPARSLVRG
jgi:hypothetical protein